MASIRRILLVLYLDVTVQYPDLGSSCHPVLTIQWGLAHCIQSLLGMMPDR